MRCALAAGGLILLSLFVARRAVAQEAPTCSKPEISRTAEQVQLVRKALLALPVKDLDTDVTPEAQQAIAAMKARLGDFVDAYMRCAPPDVAPGTAQRDLSELAHASMLEPRGYSKNEIPAERDHYGFQLSFDVRMDPGSRIIGVVVDLQINCGMDAALFVFSRGSDIWQEKLRWEAKDYNTVAGAFWSFGYEIAPPDRNGRWFVAVKHVAPWCSSTHSVIRYSVLRPRPDTVIPIELFRGSDKMWWGGDDLGRLSVRAAGFDLQFHDFDGDFETLIAKKFEISGDRVRLVTATTQRTPGR